MTELASIDKVVIIDNTPLPEDGANCKNDITAMLTVRTDFEMTYNIK